MPLRSGDILITRFDDGAFKGGLVDPKEVVKYISRGVEVHSVANLHAKVFVFDDRALVGSTNVSANSAHHLIEAVCESNTPGFVAAARRFVKSLRGDRVGLEFAQTKIGIYRPPNLLRRRSATQRSIPLQSALSVAILEETDYDERDERIAQEGSAAANREIHDPRKFFVDKFRWTGNVPAYFRKGSRILRCTRHGERKITVEEPARILSIRKYRSARVSRTMIFVEARKWSRERVLSSVIRKVPGAILLKKVDSSREIKNAEFAFQLGQVWASSR